MSVIRKLSSSVRLKRTILFPDARLLFLSFGMYVLVPRVYYQQPHKDGALFRAWSRTIRCTDWLTAPYTRDSNSGITHWNDNMEHGRLLCIFHTVTVSIIDEIRRLSFISDFNCDLPTTYDGHIYIPRWMLFRQIRVEPCGLYRLKLLCYWFFAQQMTKHVIIFQDYNMEWKIKNNEIHCIGQHLITATYSKFNWSYL